MLQNSPTSTTPVNILILRSSYLVSAVHHTACVREKTNLGWVTHHSLWEGCVNDEVSIVRNNGSGLHFTHSKTQTWEAVFDVVWRAQVGKVEQDLGVGEWCDLNGDSVFPLQVSADESPWARCFVPDLR